MPVSGNVQNNDNIFNMMSYSPFETTLIFIHTAIASITHNYGTSACLPYHCVHIFAQFTFSGFSESTTLGVPFFSLLVVAGTF